MGILRSRFGVAAIVLLGVCMAPYLRAWDYGLINLDDYLYITQHAFVRSWQGVESVRQCLASMQDGIWMPLTLLSYAADWSVFGGWYGGFHLHSILIHFINACLVWKLLSVLFPQRRLSCLFAALVWAVHPLRCESVVFLASRKDLLSFFWELLALLTWVSATRTDDRRTGRVAALTGLATLFFVLGSMCKPSVMTFPLLCLVLDAFIHRRVYPMRYVLPCCYMVFLFAFASVQQASGDATTDMFGQPLWGRLLNAAAAYGIYLRNFLWPDALAVQCLRRWPELPRFWIPGLAISAAAAVLIGRRLYALWGARREVAAVTMKEGLPSRIDLSFGPSPEFAGLLWFTLAVAPMLGIVSFGYHAYADRFTYIPAVGLSVVLVGAAGRFAGRLGPVRRALPFAGAVCVALLCVRTWRQTGYWENEKVAFEHTLEVDGERNAFAHGALAKWYFEFPHDMERCVEEFETAYGQNMAFAMDIYHFYVIGLLELGREGEIDGAMRRFESVLREHLGEEAQRSIVTLDGSISSEARKYLAVSYRLCRIAWLLGDRSTLPVAKAAIEEVENYTVFRNLAVFNYLRMMYCERVGDGAEAARIRREIVTDEDNIGFNQCRFLRSDR